MERRNRYRNPINAGAVFRVIFICAFLGCVGGAFVYMRNLHVRQGDKIRNVEAEIAELDQQNRMWELRLAAAKDRIELNRRLEWMGSDLRPLDPSRVITIRAQENR